jgi:hypothetical protein
MASDNLTRPWEGGSMFQQLVTAFEDQHKPSKRFIAVLISATLAATALAAMAATAVPPYLYP